MLRNEGVRAMFKGMSYPLLSAGALNAIYFGTYGLALDAIKNIKRSTNSTLHATEPTSWDRFLAGCAGGATQLVVSCPVDLVKIKLQVQTDVRLAKIYQGPFDVLKKVYHAEGLKGCYRGLTIQSFRDIPTFGCYVVVYDSLSRELEERYG